MLLMPPRDGVLNCMCFLEMQGRRGALLIRQWKHLHFQDVAKLNLAPSVTFFTEEGSHENIFNSAVAC